MNSVFSRQSGFLQTLKQALCYEWKVHENTLYHQILIKPIQENYRLYKWFMNSVRAHYLSSSGIYLNFISFINNTPWYELKRYTTCVLIQIQPWARICTYMGPFLTVREDTCSCGYLHYPLCGDECLLFPVVNKPVSCGSQKVNSVKTSDSLFTTMLNLW